MISSNTKSRPHKHALFMIASSNMYFHIAALKKQKKSFLSGECEHARDHMYTGRAKIMISSSTKSRPHKHGLFMIGPPNMYCHAGALEKQKTNVFAYGA